MWCFCLSVSVVNSESEKVSPEGAFSLCDNQGWNSTQILQSSGITLSQMRCIELCCAKGGTMLLQTCKLPRRPKINFLANKNMMKYHICKGGIQTSPLTRMPYKPMWELLSENADSRKLNCFAEMSLFWWKVTTGNTLSKRLAFSVLTLPLCPRIQRSSSLSAGKPGNVILHSKFHSVLVACKYGISELLRALLHSLANNVEQRDPEGQATIFLC